MRESMWKNEENKTRREKRKNIEKKTEKKRAFKEEVHLVAHIYIDRPDLITNRKICSVN